MYFFVYGSVKLLLYIGTIIIKYNSVRIVDYTEAVHKGRHVAGLIFYPSSTKTQKNKHTKTMCS